MTGKKKRSTSPAEKTALAPTTASGSVIHPDAATGIEVVRGGATGYWLTPTDATNALPLEDDELGVGAPARGFAHLLEKYVLVGLTRRDADVWSHVTARSFYTQGIRATDIVIHAASLAMLNR